MLSQLGYGVTLAVNGAEALSPAGVHREIDLLVTDMVMAQLGGR